MKIAIDIRSLMEGRHSGVEEYTIQLIHALIRNAPQHTYHLFYNSFKEVTLPDFGRGRVVVHRFGFPNKLFNVLQFLLGFPAWDMLLRQRMDIIVIPSVRLTPIQGKVPIISVMHDLSYERFPEFLTLWRRIWHKIMKPKKLMNMSAHILADSEHTKEDLTQIYNIAADEISVVYPGVPDIEKASQQRIHEARKKYSLPPRYILSFGSLEPRKNITSIIQAWSAIAGTVAQDLVIAGDKSWRQHEVDAAIESSIYKDRIHLIGFVEEEYKGAVYAAADLFVYPSFYEGFGFPPLEALLSGTPVITSFNSALPEVVGRWATLIDPYNPSQLAAVMRQLLHRRERISPEVQKEIRATYSWNDSAKKILAIVDTICISQLTQEPGIGRE